MLAVRVVLWIGFVGIDEGFEFGTEVFKFLLADHQSEFDRICIAESEYSVGDALFVLKQIIGHKTYGGLAGNGSFLPAIVADFEIFERIDALFGSTVSTSAD